MGVVLAAGASSRLGSAKQLLKVRGRTLLQHVIDEVSASSLDEIVVVLGNEADRVRTTLTRPPNVRLTENPDWRQGQSTSLLVGLSEALPDHDAAVIVLGDQPFLPRGVVDTVIAAWRGSPALAIRATYGGVPSHPVLLDRRIWDRLDLTGDQGARSVLRSLGRELTELEIGARLPVDVDTWEDFEALGGSRPTRFH